MKKYLLCTTALLSVGVLFGQTRATRTSTANGNATNPLVWDCFCVPLPGDNIIINHAITLDNDFGYTSGSVTVNASGSLIGDVPTRGFAYSGGSFTNSGTVQLGDFYHGGGTFSNTGTFTILNAFVSDGTVNTVNSGTFNVNDTLYINTNATLTNSNAVNAKSTASAGTITNTGYFTGDDVLSTGTINNNSGMGFDIDNMYNGGTINNSAQMKLSLDFWNSENVTNGAHVIIGHNYWNGDTLGGTATFTNNGTISVANDLANSETMDGSGKYCVANSTANSGTVTGTLDVCDLTGTGFDSNIGTISGTVTNCATSCSIGINESGVLNHTLYPNPFTTTVRLETGMADTYSFTLMNSLGEIVYSAKFSGYSFTFDGSNLAQGAYVYQLNGTSASTSGTLMK